MLPSLTVANAQIFDLAINPLDNALYGVVTPGVVYRIDPATGATTTAGTAVPPTVTNAIGSAFFNAAGTLYGYQNGGVFGTINLGTGAFTQTGTPGSAAQSDGASCAFGPPPSITLLKLGRNTSAGTFSDGSASIGVKPGEAVEYCIVYSNAGGAASNFVLRDYVPVGMVTVPDAYAPGKGLRLSNDVAAVGGPATPAGTNLTNASDTDQGVLDSAPIANPGDPAGSPRRPGLMTLTLPGVAANSKGTVCFQARVP